MGFPIRKSADQRLFAPPHGISQRTTSFIASQRQGIHRIPLLHLIALIIDVHHVSFTSAEDETLSRSLHPEKQARTRSKDQFCFKHTRGRRSGCVHCWLCSLRVRPSKAASPKAHKTIGVRSQRPDMFTLHDVRYLRVQLISTKHEAVWMDEIPRRRAFSAGLPKAKVGAGNQPVRSASIKPAGETTSKEVVEPDGIEPTTSSLQS